MQRKHGELVSIGDALSGLDVLVVQSRHHLTFFDPMNEQFGLGEAGLN